MVQKHMTNGDSIILPTRIEFLESYLLPKEGYFSKKFRKVLKIEGKSEYLPNLYNDTPRKNIFSPGIVGTWEAGE